LGEELKALAREKQQLAEENQALKQARDAALKDARTSRESYQQLKAESGEIIKYRRENIQLRTEVDQQAAQIRELTETAEAAKYATAIKWFLAGAGVLVLGWLMGWALGRRKRRWNSPLY
jgi:SH3 domain protein